MQATLTAPYADVRAADLVLELDAPGAPALETVELALGGFRLELRLLGHSHQAVATAPGFALSETVSCRPGEGRDAHLPAARAVRRDGHAYAFSADVLALEGFDGAALVAAVAADPHGLVGVFGGQADASTARTEAFAGRADASTAQADMLAGQANASTAQAGAFTALRGAAVEEPGAFGIRWETWHAYPQTGELVRTTGQVLRT